MDFEAPLLTMQVTKVKHASLVLWLAMNHCLTDDLSAAEFLRCRTGYRATPSFACCISDVGDLHVNQRQPVPSKAPTRCSSTLMSRTEAHTRHGRRRR
jgi:hypothetical protein